MSAGQPVRVVLAEDSVLLREGLVRLFSELDELELVETATSLPSLLDMVEETAPDVLITDIRMPPTHTDEGIQAARILRDTAPDVGVLVLSQYAEPSFAADLFEDGTTRRGYLLKDRISQVRELLQAVGSIAAGGSVVDPVVVEALVAPGTAGADRLDRLTPREQEVLGLMAQGLTNRAIAEELVVSISAVEKHVGSVLDKLDLPADADVNRRVRAVVLYLTATG